MNVAQEYMSIPISFAYRHLTFSKNVSAAWQPDRGCAEYEPVAYFWV